MAVSFSKYGNDVLNGNVFSASSAAAGVVVPIYTNTTQTTSLWNPQGSGKNIVLLRVDLGYISQTFAAGCIVYSSQGSVGSSAGTTAPITVFTTGTIKNCLVGSGNQSSMMFAPATCTLTAANTLYRNSGLSFFASAAATSTAPVFQFTDNVDGSIVIPPGTVFSVSGNIAVLVTAIVTLTWEEV